MVMKIARLFVKTILHFEQNNSSKKTPGNNI